MTPKLKPCPICTTPIPQTAKACKAHLHLCIYCKVAETPTERHTACVACRKIADKDIRDRANAKSNAKLKAARQANPTMTPCRCGCGALVKHPQKWTPECKVANEAAIYAAVREKEKKRRREEAAARKEEAAATVAVKPLPTVTPPPTLSQLLDEAAELRERRAGLNPELLMQRVMRGAVMSVAGVLT